MAQKKVTGIILAAGDSTRFGQNKNKNLFDVNDKTIIEYSIEVFNQNPKIDDIILVVKGTEKEYFENIVNDIKINKPFRYVEGGRTRMESVYHALKETQSDITIIHDGARPRIKNEYIDRCIEQMENFKGATVAVKAKDTIKVCDEEGVVVNTTKRTNTYLVQTPQCFDRKILLELHEKYKGDDEITDDCMVLEKGGYKIKVVPGDYTNIKVTTYDDLLLCGYDSQQI